MSQPSKNTMIRKHVFAAPAAANNTGIHAAITLPTSGTTVVTTGLTNPDVPRTVRLKGNATTVQGLTPVVVTGTDWKDQPLTENVTMGGAFATPTDTVNAFKTVTSVTVPTRGASGDTISVGFGPSLGVGSYLDAYSFLPFTSSLITSYTYDSAVISKNTVLLAATLDGSTDQCVFYVPDVFGTGRQWG